MKWIKNTETVAYYCSYCYAIIFISKDMKLPNICSWCRKEQDANREEG